MVTEKKIGNKTVYLCDICSLGYADRATAQECKDYCRAHKRSCSAEISKKAVYLPNAPTLPEKEEDPKRLLQLTQPYRAFSPQIKFLTAFSFL